MNNHLGVYTDSLKIKTSRKNSAAEKKTHQNDKVIETLYTYNS